MKAVKRQLGLLVLLASHALAQGAPTTLQGVKVTRASNDVQIEFALTSSVQPSVLVTTDPSRLVLDFPNTTTNPNQQRVEVNFNGIKAVRFALYQTHPLVTRVVVDLDGAHPYQLHSIGGQLTLTVNPSVAAKAKPRRPPPAAASGGFLEIFRRRSPSSPEISSDDNLKRPIPSASSAPTAAHPNRGSLQEGTVFPGLGSPGTGNVPSGTAGAPVAASPVTTAANVPVASPKTAPSPTASMGVPGQANPNPVSAQPASQVAQAATSKDDSVSPMPPASQSTANNSQAVAATLPAPANPPVTKSQPSPAAVSNSDQALIVSGKVRPQEPAESKSPPVASQSNEPTAPELSATAATPPESQEVTDQSPSAPAIDPNLKTVFRVKYVAEGVAYLDGGRNSGLTEGMKLEIKDTDLPMRQGSTADSNDPRVVAELEVVAVAETSAVTDIHTPKRAVKQGDLAYLSSGDAQALIEQRALSATRKYPLVVTFTEDDPQDEEARAVVPRPPLPSVNRARGWIGFDHMGTITHGSAPTTSSDLGLVMRADITRLNGTYWNLSGYWRGRLSSRSSSSQQTLQDLINRTYHLGMTYENPNSHWVAGVGRLYLPWAPSLNTIDGGYFGTRFGHGATAGIFAGSTPDPTSWNYNPDQRIGGAFINFQGGSYDNFYYTSTSGVGVSLLKWQMDRPFVFFENTLSYKRYVSIYDSLQADSPRGNPAVPTPGAGLSRNFLTVRLQVHPRLELDLNHNYFRDIPTFDPTLVGTGLLDKYLFQGFSVGARTEVVKQIFVYTDLGRSNRTGDTKNSWNQMFGVTFNRLPWLGLRADTHYSRFNSSFGDGAYKSFSLSRDFIDSLRLGILAGTQNYTSTLAANNNSRFLNGNAEWSFGSHYFTQAGFTANRGDSLSYDQWLFTLGWRFDSKGKHQ